MRGGRIRPEDWVVDPEDRTTYYGATSIARILGVSRYGGPVDEFLEKREKMLRPGSRRARWGQLLEDAICTGYGETYSRRLRRVDHWRCRDSRLVILHPDRIVLHEPGLVDGKATEVRADYGEPMTDQVPPWVKVQMVIYLGASGREWADVAVLPGATRGLDVYRVLPDPDLYAASLAAVEQFHVDHVLADVPPGPDGSESWSEFVRSRYAQDDGATMLPATAEQMLLVDELREAVTAHEIAKGRLELAKQAIQDVMLEHAALPTPAGWITWRTSEPAPRWKAIAERLAANRKPGTLERLVEADKAGRVGPRPFLHPFTSEVAHARAS